MHAQCATVKLFASWLCNAGLCETTISAGFAANAADIPLIQVIANIWREWHAVCYIANRV
jgi:hypothetical protein